MPNSSRAAWSVTLEDNGNLKTALTQQEIWAAPPWSRLGPTWTGYSWPPSLPQEQDPDLQHRGGNPSSPCSVSETKMKDNSVRQRGAIPPVEISLKGGTGGCMLGGSEDDLCRPIASKEPGFQLPDAGDWPIPPRPDNWTEREKQQSY